MNSISFTQTRSTLSSADLRISESLAKPLQTMNVETLEHSPSVTISIFDALAEILTSTPRTPRLSTTTAVTPNQNNNDKQTLNGVSNSITVNSQDPLTTFADVNAYTKSVKITEQTTPNVFNNLSFGETATPSLNTERATARPVNTPTPTPTTPLSARKPFAIKVLYSGTDTSIDKSTAFDSTTSDKPSTDSPITVFNKVSDLLLTNNNLVSSELTSMLSNNINNIIQNMDKRTRSKISVDDMVNLLRTLIPRALDLTNVNDDTNIPETTPYSLEDINDTANIKVGTETIRDSNTTDTLQAVKVDDSVDRAQTDIFSTLEILDTPSQAVNNVGSSQGAVSSTLPAFSSQMTSVGTTETIANLTSNVSSTTIPTKTTSVISTTSSGSEDTEMVNVNIQNNILGESSKNSTNTNVPLPFFTNFKVVDFTPSDTEDPGEMSTTVLQPLHLTTKSVSSSQTPATTGPQDPSQVSPFEYWVLSKKARVLQMIEDLIRQHNDEIATAPPLTELLTQSNNIPLSNRLTEIINTMTSTTAFTSAVNNDDISSSSATPTVSPFPLFTTLSPQSDSFTNGSPENNRTTVVTTTEGIATIEDVLQTISQFDVDLSTRFGTPTSTTAGMQTEVSDSTTSATTNQEVNEVSNRLQQDTIQTTFQENTETTTAISNTETTQNIDTTTSMNLLTETLETDDNTTRRASQNETKQNPVSIVSNKLVVSNEPPKKDYVIFGILPNNTVVRKDPNDDILETITESSPYIVYGVLPNNTIIRRFPNGTRVPRVMQRVEVLPISPWSLRNPYSPIHNNPAIVRPQSNPIRVSTNIVTSTVSSNNGTENLTNDTVNNQQPMVLTLSSLA